MYLSQIHSFPLTPLLYSFILLPNFDFIRPYCRPVFLYSVIMYTSVSKIVAFGLLASVPLASAYAIPSQYQDLTKKDEASILDWL
jgi:hypothetical protein